MRAFCLPEVQCKKSSSERFTRQEVKIPKGKIGGDETIFGRCEGAESGAYLRYVSIYDASKGQKELIGTIYRTRSKKFNNNKKAKDYELCKDYGATIALQ